MNAFMPRTIGSSSRCVAERLVAHQQKIHVLRRDVVVERRVARVVRQPVQPRGRRLRKPLRPDADRVLAVEDELDRLVERRLVFRILLLDVEAQEELRRFRRAGIVKGGVAVVVLKLFEPPRVLADGVVPVLAATPRRRNRRCSSSRPTDAARTSAPTRPARRRGSNSRRRWRDRRRETDAPSTACPAAESRSSSAWLPFRPTAASCPARYDHT